MNEHNWLLPICKTHNITLVELGRRIGKSKQYMTELGRSRIRLSYEIAIKIADALGTTPDTLFLSIKSSEPGLTPQTPTGTEG